MSDTVSKIPLSENYAYGPFGVTLASAVYLMILPVFLLWRMKKRDRDFPVSDNEKKVTYLLFIAVAAMQLSELLKAAFFGLGSFYADSNSARYPLQVAFNIFAEVAHVFTFAAVFSRLIGLVNHETGSVSKLENIGYLVILGLRAACPLFALVSLSQVNTFSKYELGMYAFEGTICLLATVRAYSFLKAIRKQQNLNLPTLALFSNPIATGIVTGAAFLAAILLIVGYTGYIERQLVTLNSINYYIPSFYNVLVASVLCFFYHDTKSLLSEARTPSNNGKGFKKMKFNMAAILS